MRRVLQLVGSAESEFFADLSVLYARDCLTATAGQATTDIAYVSPDRAWRFPDGLDPEDLTDAEPMALPDALAHIVELGVDAMVPQMFCLPGMVEYRALFDVLGIPHLGNRAETMALTAHKQRAKAVVAAAGVSVARGEVVTGEPPHDLALPAVVKPVDGDNSTGVRLVRDRSQLGAAVAEAARTTRAGVLVETYVELGREVRCGILEREGELVALPLEEYTVSADRPIRDAADKLARDGSGQLELVAKDAAHAVIVDVDDPVCEAVWAAARTCYRALGCRHYGLFDFRVDPAGRPVFLEAGLYCSFATQSVLATMAAAAGIHVGELFTTVLESALAPRP